eukprot:749481-Hanusia_phi.AAC.21
MSESAIKPSPQCLEGHDLTFPFKEFFDDPERTQDYSREDTIRHAHEFVLLNDHLLSPQIEDASSTASASKHSECLDGLLHYLVCCMHAVAWSLVRFNEGKGLPSNEFQRALETFMGRILLNIRWSVLNQQHRFRNENIQVICNCCSENAWNHEMMKEISQRFASEISPNVKQMVHEEFCKMQSHEKPPACPIAESKDFFKSQALRISPLRALGTGESRNEKPLKARDAVVNVSTVGSNRVIFASLKGVQIVTEAFSTNIQDLRAEEDQQYILMVVELLKQVRSLPSEASQWFFRITTVVMWNTVRRLTSDDSAQSTSFCEQLMLAAFELGKKVDFIHFKYNLELIYACYVFTNLSETCLNNLPPRLSMIRMAVSIVLTMLKRAGEDSDWQVQDELHKPDVEILRSVCKTAPSAVEENEREWDCKRAYSMLDRVVVFFSVCGSSMLKFCYDYLRKEMSQPDKEDLTAKHDLPAAENNETTLVSSKKKLLTIDNQGTSTSGSVPSSHSASDREVQGPSSNLEASKRSYDLTDAILMLMEDWMFRFDAQTCFGPLVQSSFDSDVLNSFLLFLNVASETLRGKVRGRLSRCYEVTQLLIDNKYINGGTAGKIIEKMWLEDSLLVPSEVLRLLVRILLHHIEHECQGNSSVMVMQMWENSLQRFKYLLERCGDQGKRDECGRPESEELSKSNSKELGNVIELVILLSFGFHTLPTEKKTEIFKELISIYAKTHFCRHFTSPLPRFLDDLSNLISMESLQHVSVDLQDIDQTIGVLNGAYLATGSNSESFARWYIMADAFAPGSLDPSIKSLLEMDGSDLLSCLRTASSTLMASLYMSPSQSCSRALNALMLLMAWRFLQDLDAQRDRVAFDLDACVALVRQTDFSVFEFLLCVQKLSDVNVKSEDQLLQMLRSCQQLMAEVVRYDGSEHSAMRATVGCLAMDALLGMQTRAVEMFLRGLEDAQDLAFSPRVRQDVIDVVIGSLQTCTSFLFSAWSLCIDRCMSEYPTFSRECVKLGFSLPSSELPAILQDERGKKLREVRAELLSVLSRREGLNTWLIEIQASVTVSMGNSDAVGDSHVNTLLSLSGQIFNQIATISKLLEKATEASDLSLKNSVEKLSMLMAHFSVDCRLQHFLSGSPTEVARSDRICSSIEDYQNLIDVLKMHRIDILLDSVQTQEMSLEGSACDVLHETLNTLQEMIADPKRCSSFASFYFDSNSRTASSSKSVLLVEVASSKGNIQCTLDVLSRSNSLVILKRVVKLFRSILENPATASLARSKPAVRRKIAEYFTSLGKKQTKRLLEKLLLSPLNIPDRSTLSESNHGNAQDAAILRRSTLRLFALVLDGVDESIEQFENILLDAMLDLIPKMIKCSKTVVRECFAGVKFVCFRESQSRVEQMIDLIVDSLGSSQDLGTPECAANLADMLSSLIASLQSSARQPFSDLGSVTSGQVRASDTLSTVMLFLSSLSSSQCPHQVSTSSEVSNEGGMSYTSRGESTVATSAITYISSTGHMDPDDSSAVGRMSVLVDCL